LQSQRKARQLISRPETFVSLPKKVDVAAFDLETSFLEEGTNQRWLLTSCIAGIAGTLIVGGSMLGLFGHNIRPTDASAAVEMKAEITSTLNPLPAEKPNNEIKSEIIAERDLNDGFAYPKITADELPYSKSKTTVLDAEIVSVSRQSENITTISKTPPPEPIDETFQLAKGSTLIEALANRGVPQATAEALAASIDPVYPLSRIAPGTKFEVTFDRQIDFYGREVTFPVEVAFKTDSNETVTVDSDEDGQFATQIDGAPKPEAPETPKVAAKPVITQFRSVAQIGAGLYSTAKDNKIPDYIVGEFTRVFSYDVDFQRQVEASDSFEVFYGNPFTGTSSKRKVLHFAKLTSDGQTRVYYRFTTSDGQTAYFDENGRSAARSLLKTPVSGAKLTSGFGMRVHPLLAYSKMHAGVDFGAPSGTPIHAAGDGVIAQAGRESGYGNVIEIKHNATYKTMYAHMRSFATGIRAGVRVNQGQVIGYVGTTGRSTGPHLHYEVRINDRPVNPTSIRTAGGNQLAGKDLLNFKLNKQRVLTMMQNAPSAALVAQANQ
jgi:murein DD-endopeptidase MepM/ murein hydrolase activator NlpD